MDINGITTFNIDRYIQDKGLVGWDRSMGTNNDWYRLTQLVDSSTFPNFIEEIVLEGMEEIVQTELIAEKLFTKETSSGPVITWLEEHGFDAQVLAEGEAPQFATIRHAKKAFGGVKFGLGLSFTNGALRDVNKLDVFGRHIKGVARAIMYKENQYLFAVAMNGIADGTTAHKTGDIYSSHLLNGNNASWTNSGVMDAEKIQVVTQIGSEEGFNYSKMIVNPATLTAMLSLDEFKASNIIQYLSANAESIIDGNSARPYFLPNGMEVVSNRAFPSGYAMFVDPSRFGSYYPIEGMTSVSLPVDLARTLAMGFYKESTAVAKKPGAGVLISNLSVKNPADYVS